MFPNNSKSITLIICYKFNFRSNNSIQIHRTFCKESHLRTKHAVFLYICLRRTLYFNSLESKQKQNIISENTGCRAQIEQPWAQRIIASFKVSF